MHRLINYNIIFIFLFLVGCHAKKLPPIIIDVKKDTVMQIKAKPILVLDAGHGALDPGAINDSLNLYEKNVTRKIVDAVLAIIDTNKISVIQTRPADSNIHRHDRINLANTYNPDLLLSVHINYDKDTSYNGFEIAIADSLVTKMDEKDTISISNPNKVKAEKMATTFTNKVAGLFPKMRHRKMKIRNDRIWMICAGNYPSLLLEFGFISNKNDLGYITDKKSIKKLASGIVDCIYKELLPQRIINKVKVKSKKKY
jgi:N-acetylmuramoyl-L-alanine amidase